MSVDKLVDSTLLDASCTYEAGKIRAKLGSAAQITYDLANGKGFGDAIEAIETGGGGTDYSGLMDGSFSGALSDPNITGLRTQAFTACNSITSIALPNLTSINASSIYNCSQISSINVPKLKTVNGNYGMASLPSLTSIVLPSITSGVGQFMFSNDTALAIADIGASSGGLGGQSFANCSALKTLILRKTSVVSCAVNTFNGTPAASGGSGMTIYIPKTLYDALGTGTSSDYKAATNWSTYNGYGTITWAKIEGSIYENAYADGTSIS